MFKRFAVNPTVSLVRKFTAHNENRLAFIRAMEKRSDMVSMAGGECSSSKDSTACIDESPTDSDGRTSGDDETCTTRNGHKFKECDSRGRTPKWGAHFKGVSVPQEADFAQLPPPPPDATTIEQLSQQYPRRYNAQLQATLEGIYAKRNGMPKQRDIIKCARCWMTHGEHHNYCFCSSIRPMAECNVKVYVYVHWREATHRKASNTAKLIPMALPHGEIVACGDVAAEARMVRDLEAHDRAAILFPSTDAITVQDWYGQLLAAGMRAQHTFQSLPTASACPTSPAALSASGADIPFVPSTGKSPIDDGDSNKRVTLVLLDGTWPEARKLNLFLPEATPRVKLATIPKHVQDLRTRWAHPDKDNIQSFGALLGALTELGASPAHEARLSEQLELAVSKYAEQTFPEKMQKPMTTRAERRSTKDRRKVEIESSPEL
eukprot:m.1478302 g.1478302  ORF g.1478302 m.1478302 type:complete len:434 (-) comp25165_c0_seq6:3603-4904(-)